MEYFFLALQGSKQFSATLGLSRNDLTLKEVASWGVIYIIYINHHVGFAHQTKRILETILCDPLFISPLPHFHFLHNIMKTTSCLYCVYHTPMSIPESLNATKFVNKRTEFVTTCFTFVKIFSNLVKST